MATMTPQVALKRIATYERVSSDDQRERETIQTQRQVLDQCIGAAGDVELVGRYTDDGVSGTIAFALRPDGGRLLADAARGAFEELWVYRIDRLGRDDVDPLVVWQKLEALKIKVRSVTEGYTDPFMYHIHVAVAAEARRAFLQSSADGTERAAKAGRFCGGIAPYGYRVEGIRHNARLVPDETPIAGELSKADVIRLLFDLVGREQRSLSAAATHLNSLGIRTPYCQDGRTRNGRPTQPTWRKQILSRLIKEPVYRGESLYGRRSKQPGRDVISAPVPALVSDELWWRAQAVVRRHLCHSRASHGLYLLQGLITCGVCGSSYCAAHHQGRTRYRCSGQLRRLGWPNVCRSKSLRADILEPILWGDIEQFLKDPYCLPKELQRVTPSEEKMVATQAERAAIRAEITERRRERERLLDLAQRGILTPGELELRLEKVTENKGALERRLAELEKSEPARASIPVDERLLAAIRHRLADGFTDQERKEILRLLVQEVTIHTYQKADGRKAVKAVTEYAFPETAFHVCDGPAGECERPSGRNRLYRRVIDVPTGYGRPRCHDPAQRGPDASTKLEPCAANARSPSVTRP